MPSSTEPFGEASVYSASGMDSSSRILFLRVSKTDGISGRDGELIFKLSVGFWAVPNAQVPASARFKFQGASPGLNLKLILVSGWLAAMPIYIPRFQIWVYPQTQHYTGTDYYDHSSLKCTELTVILTNSAPLSGMCKNCVREAIDRRSQKILRVKDCGKQKKAENEDDQHKTRFYCTI